MFLEKKKDQTKGGKENWSVVPPKAFEPWTRTRRGKVYHYSMHCGFWALHQPGKGKNCLGNPNRASQGIRGQEQEGSISFAAPFGSSGVSQSSGTSFPPAYPIFVQQSKPFAARGPPLFGMAKAPAPSTATPSPFGVASQSPFGPSQASPFTFPATAASHLNFCVAAPPANSSAFGVAKAPEARTTAATPSPFGVGPRRAGSPAFGVAKSHQARTTAGQPSLFGAGGHPYLFGVVGAAETTAAGAPPFGAGGNPSLFTVANTPLSVATEPRGGFGNAAGTNPSLFAVAKSREATAGAQSLVGAGGHPSLFSVAWAAETTATAAPPVGAGGNPAAFGVAKTPFSVATEPKGGFGNAAGTNPSLFAVAKSHEATAGTQSLVSAGGHPSLFSVARAAETTATAAPVAKTPFCVVTEPRGGFGNAAGTNPSLFGAANNPAIAVPTATATSSSCGAASTPLRLDCAGGGAPEQRLFHSGGSCGESAHRNKPAFSFPTSARNRLSCSSFNFGNGTSTAGSNQPNSDQAFQLPSCTTNMDHHNAGPRDSPSLLFGHHCPQPRAVTPTMPAPPTGVAPPARNSYNGFKLQLTLLEAKRRELEQYLVR